MARSEFSVEVRKQAWERCAGRCEGEGCGLKLFPAQFDYDHDIPDGLGGKPTLENCKVLCKSCHLAKTHGQDNPRMTKADNIRKKFLKQEPKGRGFPKPPPGFRYSWRTGRMEKTDG